MAGEQAQKLQRDSVRRGSGSERKLSENAEASRLLKTKELHIQIAASLSGNPPQHAEGSGLSKMDCRYSWIMR